MLTLGMLRAVDAAPRQESREVGDRDPEHLSGQNVIHPLLEVRDLLGQAFGKAAGDLTQEHAGLRARIEKSHRAVRPDGCAPVVSRPGLGKRVQHPVRELGRGEDLVIREIRDTGQDVGIAPAEREARLAVHADARGSSPPARPRTVMGGQVLAGMKTSCFPRSANRDPSSPKADIWVRMSSRKSRRWNLPFPRYPHSAKVIAWPPCVRIVRASPWTKFWDST